jgi:Cu/Zn superoxide dismutase
MPTFQMTGFEQFEAQFKARIKQIVNVTNDRARETAESIRDLAIEYCPEDTGQLVESIEVVSSGVEQGRNDLGQFSSDSIISYTVKAGNESTPHALAVHENPSRHDPPSWQGKVVNFRKGGSHFLARAFRDHENDMKTRLGKKIF